MSLRDGATRFPAGFAKHRAGLVFSEQCSYWTVAGTCPPYVSYLALWKRSALLFLALSTGRQTCWDCQNGRENPAFLSKGMFGEEWSESALCPHPSHHAVGWFHKGKEGGEKSVRTSQMKNTSTLAEIDFSIRNLVMATIIFLNLSCL